MLLFLVVVKMSSNNSGSDPFQGSESEYESAESPESDSTSSGK